MASKTPQPKTPVATPPAVPRNPEIETLPHGRYIPYSGGSMGWFENQGVLKSERRNGYRFFTEMESEYVRSALFQRWSQVTDKRRAKRISKENSVNMLMADESGRETAYRMQTEHGVLEGTTRDVSLYGMRLTFTKPIELTEGATVSVTLLGAGSGEVLLEIPATVVWTKREVVVRPVWFVGVSFMQLTAETEAFLGEFLRH